MSIYIVFLGELIMAVQTKVSNDIQPYQGDPPASEVNAILYAQIATWQSEGKTDGILTYEDRNGDGWNEWVIRTWSDQTSADAYVAFVNNLFPQYGWLPLNVIEFTNV